MTSPSLAHLSAHDVSVLIDFLLFAVTLGCVAVFHRHTLAAALIGLSVITLKKLLGTGFNEGPGLAGLYAHYAHEWVLIANLFLLLVGFALLARHFEASRVPDWMPVMLPDNWTGALVLLLLVFVISSFLDNIAAALIGATVARHVFKNRVRIGYLAAIVAAANAGGAGSVIGDTTTTMMWIAGVSPLQVLHAYVGAGFGLLVSGVPASLAQQKYAPLVKNPPSGLHISFKHVAVVLIVLAAAIGANVGAHLFDVDI
ncbi:MAG: citrate transporter, partial [Terriglobia bacterium]